MSYATTPLTGLNVLTAALISALVWAGMQPPLATLLVGGGLVVIGLVMGPSAIKTLKQIVFVPTRTARNVQRDAAAVKDAYQ